MKYILKKKNSLIEQAAVSIKEDVSYLDMTRKMILGLKKHIDFLPETKIDFLNFYTDICELKKVLVRFINSNEINFPTV